VRACTPHRQPERYARRRPERTPLYGIVAGHLETWLAERSLGDRPIATYVEEELRAYLRCGILSFGFARARCGTCGQGDLAEKAVAFLPSRPITTGDHDTSRIAWAKLLARIAEAFPLVCPACGGDIRLIAFIVDPGPIHTTSAGRSRPTSNRRFASGRRPGWLRQREVEPPPVSPARGPPTEWTELVQAHDDRDVTQAELDEFPVIDIHSL